MFKDANGVLQKVDKLSIGTIDQIYLGFRFAIADRYEELPLIFDETFVYFDDERLKNVIEIIEEMSKARQIIILSCSQREKECMDKLNIHYNSISI